MTIALNLLSSIFLMEVAAVVVAVVAVKTITTLKTILLNKICMILMCKNTVS